MRKIVSVLAAGALLLTASTAALADTVSEGALPAADPHPAATETTSGFAGMSAGTTAAVAAVVLTAVVVAVAASSSSSSTSH
ncbi:MAG TPA: hypothetical protein VGG10_18110 [Rhizomicrobium sp.]|jgi:hypothetical protein